MPHNNQTFYYELRNLLLRIINERIHAYGAQVTAKIPPEYVQSILIDSLLGVLMVWINKPVPEKPAEFAKIISQTRLLAPLELLDFESWVYNWQALRMAKGSLSWIAGQFFLILKFKNLFWNFS